MADERDRELKEYLLGTLPEPAMQALEESYFKDDAMFEQIEQAEHALIDEYLEKRLSEADRDQFERHFLTAPARAKRVAIASALRETATSAMLRERRTAVLPSTRVWLAIAASIILATALWFVMARLSPPQPSPQAGPPPQAQPSPPLPEPPSSEREVPIVALVLSPVSTRGAESPAEIRASGPTRVEIDLLGLGTPAGGRVEIRSVDAGVVWTGEARAASPASARGAVAHVTVPMDRLPPGDYILTLWPSSPSRGAVPVGTYYFRVSPP